MDNSPYFKDSDPSTYQQLAPNVGCVVSNRVSVDGKSIRYIEKDQIDGDWTFYAGDEDEAYTSDSKNFQLFSLNTIANIDSSIIPLLDAQPGTAFERSAKQEPWRKVES